MCYRTKHIDNGNDVSVRCKHVGPASVGSTLCLQTHHQNSGTWRSPSAWLFRKYTAAHRYSAVPSHLSIDKNIRPGAPSDATQAATTFALRTSVRLARMRRPNRSGESRRNRSPLSLARTIAVDSQKKKNRNKIISRHLYVHLSYNFWLP